MYHQIVRSKIRSLFAEVDRGNAQPVLDGFARNFEHRFLGEDHALGGARHSLESTREWYARLYRLLPGIRFDLIDIFVAGLPWNTIAIINWREQNDGADGVWTENFGIHAVRLSWGKVTQIIICPNTMGLKTTLDRLYTAGVSEAHAPPIVD